MHANISELAKQVGRVLSEKKVSIVIAESCTGGLLASSITDVPGSSGYFDRGFVVYSNVAKQEVLGVGGQTIGEFGAISEQVAQEMAAGALKRSHAQIGIAITGIAGPGADSSGKPIGTVCFALVGLELPVKAVTMRFDGDRAAVKKSAVAFALMALLESL